MRFFDEDNKKFQKTLATSAVLAIIYIGSFWLIRSNTSHDDDCRRQWIDFPTGAVRTLYRPLIVWDKYLNDDLLYMGEIDEFRLARQQNCGE